MAWISSGVSSIRAVVLYFDWFDLPVSLFPDLNLLKQRFLTKSKSFHPDKFTLAPEDEKNKALELAGLNNQAFKILNNLDSRIHYILSEFGLLKDEKEQMPHDFLMKMLSFNEAISDLEDHPEGLDSLFRELNDWEDELQDDLNHCSSLQPLSPQNAAPLKSYYLKRKFYLRIKNNLSKFTPPTE
jgi:curved DNA-binding protein CbpA